MSIIESLKYLNRFGNTISKLSQLLPTSIHISLTHLPGAPFDKCTIKLIENTFRNEDPMTA